MTIHNYGRTASLIHPEICSAGSSKSSAPRTLKISRFNCNGKLEFGVFKPATINFQFIYKDERMSRYMAVGKLGSLSQVLAVQESHARAPRLQRICVLSCPIRGAGGKGVNAKLMAKINDELDKAIVRAKRKGW